MKPLPSDTPTIHLDVSLAIVNIVLLLILFFLATGQLLNPPTADIDLAETQDIPLEILPTPILVVTEDNRWTLNSTPVDPALLGVAMDALPEATTLHVLISGTTPAQTLTAVLNHPALSETTLRLVTWRKAEATP